MTRRARGRPRKEGALRILLQVRLNDAHMDFLKRVAREQQLTPAEAVRHVLHLEMKRAADPAPEPPCPSEAPAAQPLSGSPTAERMAALKQVTQAPIPMTSREQDSAADPLAAFTPSQSGVHRAFLDGWQLSLSKKDGSRMWRWYAHRGNEFTKDDPSGKARSLPAAARAAIKAVRGRTIKAG